MLLGYNFFLSANSHSTVGGLLAYLVIFENSCRLFLIHGKSWSLKLLCFFSRKHSYLFLPGVKGHQHPGTTLPPGSSPASDHTQYWRWHLPPGGSPQVPTSAHFGARELRGISTFWKIIFYIKSIGVQGGCPSKYSGDTLQKPDADLHFSKTMVATLWRMDYGGRVGAEETVRGHCQPCKWAMMVVSPRVVAVTLHRRVRIHVSRESAHSVTYL